MIKYSYTLYKNIYFNRSDYTQLNLNTEHIICNNITFINACKGRADSSDV